MLKARMSSTDGPVIIVYDSKMKFREVRWGIYVKSTCTRTSWVPFHKGGTISTRPPGVVFVLLQSLIQC